MCYLVITGGSLVWFLLSLIADMFVISAMVTPKWLIAQTPHSFSTPHVLLNVRPEQKSEITVPPPSLRYPSVGIYTRCKAMKDVGFHCGPFDLDGFATDSEIYPTFWKATMFFISLGFVLLTLTVACTLMSCCRQSFFGKSIHNMTACAQVIAGISVMMSLFLHPMGWSSRRVQLLCGPDAEPFYAADCSIGMSFYCAVVAVVLSFVSACLSLKAETSNLRSRVRRCVEKGDRLKVSSAAFNKLFVYGSLKYGQPSHSILANKGNGFAKFWCHATTTEKLPLVIATRYNIPFLLNKPGFGYYVTGEIYEVDDKMLKSLANLEDCEDVYTREMREMNIGIGEGTIPCWVYLLQKYPEKLLSLPFLSSYENSPTHPYTMRNRRHHKHPPHKDLSYSVTNA